MNESVFILDHEAKTLSCDTTDRGMAARLLRLGFTERQQAQTPAPYRRFLGRPDQLLVRKGKKIATESQKAAARVTMKALHAGSSPAQTPPDSTPAPKSTQTTPTPSGAQS